MTDASPLPMALDLAAPLPHPAWPAGIALSPFAAADAPAAHALMQMAYAQGGGSVAASWEQWWHATSTDEEFDPALCLVARAAGGDIAGFALCWSSSFVKDLVVHPDHRRRGIGEALLLAAAAAFRARGQSWLRLKVEAGNSGARRLYRRVGFTPA